MDGSETQEVPVKPADQGWNEFSIRSGIKDASLLAARREVVIAKATELFVERGFGEVSVNEIAAYAEISIGALYKYIRAKEDILWLVMGGIYGTLEDVLEAERRDADSSWDALAHVVERFYRSVDEVRSGVLLMYREYRHLPPEGQREFMEREQRVLRLFQSIIEEGIAETSFRCSNPSTIAVNILMSGHTWSLKRWLFKGADLDAYIATQLAILKSTLVVTGRP